MVIRKGHKPHPCVIDSDGMVVWLEDEIEEEVKRPKKKVSLKKKKKDLPKLPKPPETPIPRNQKNNPLDTQMMDGLRLILGMTSLYTIQPKDRSIGARPILERFFTSEYSYPEDDTFYPEMDLDSDEVGSLPSSLCGIKDNSILPRKRNSSFLDETSGKGKLFNK